MFAESGFANVSMRNLAKAVGMSVASIYHHFPDKNTLYLETVQFSFTDKAIVFSEIWNKNCSVEKKLEMFISSLFQLLFADREFHRIIQREIVDANPDRMKMLAEDVFQEQFYYLLQIMKQIAPEKDAHLSAISVLCLCIYHIEMQPLRQFLPEWKLQHEDPAILVKHVTELLLNPLKENGL